METSDAGRPDVPRRADQRYAMQARNDRTIMARLSLVLSILGAFGMFIASPAMSHRGAIAVYFALIGGMLGTAGFVTSVFALRKGPKRVALWAMALGGTCAVTFLGMIDSICKVGLDHMVNK
jgi:hypothetical protein